MRVPPKKEYRRKARRVLTFLFWLPLWPVYLVLLLWRRRMQRIERAMNPLMQLEGGVVTTVKPWAPLPEDTVVPGVRFEKFKAPPLIAPLDEFRARRAKEKKAEPDRLQEAVKEISGLEDTPKKVYLSLRERLEEKKRKRGLLPGSDTSVAAWMDRPWKEDLPQKFDKIIEEGKKNLPPGKYKGMIVKAEEVMSKKMAAPCLRIQIQPQDGSKPIYSWHKSGEVPYVLDRFDAVNRAYDGEIIWGRPEELQDRLVWYDYRKTRDGCSYVYLLGPVEEEEKKHYFWMGTEIQDLDDRHLYNIIKAIEEGSWKTTGKPCTVSFPIKRALIKEYAKRDIDEEETEAENERWEEENA